MGIMITYGSYVKKDVDLNKAVSQIEIMDTGVAFLAGVMIIPAVFVILRTGWYVSRPGLMFVSLPKVFYCMGVVGRIFFCSSCWQDLRIDILHLGTGINYRKLYGIVPHRA